MFASKSNVQKVSVETFIMHNDIPFDFWPRLTIWFLIYRHGNYTAKKNIVFKTFSVSFALETSIRMFATQIYSNQTHHWTLIFMARHWPIMMLLNFHEQADIYNIIDSSLWSNWQQGPVFCLTSWWHSITQILYWKVKYPFEN
jgi:hypothetical protein